nr:MAG TPA: hypothetical protein [Bacteriophage sp.]
MLSEGVPHPWGTPLILRCGRAIEWFGEARGRRSFMRLTHAR